MCDIKKYINVKFIITFNYNNDINHMIKYRVCITIKNI